jgi:Transglycosylase SLT domain/LysM domain
LLYFSLVIGLDKQKVASYNSQLIVQLHIVTGDDTFMITTLFTGILASALMATTSFVTPVKAPTTPIIFTQVLPVQNFVSYTIEQGDTLETIALQRYGDKRYSTNLWNDNPSITDPNNLSEGSLIKIRANKPVQPDDVVATLVKSDDVSPTPEVTVDPTKAPTMMPTPSAVPVVSPTTAVIAPAAQPSSYDAVYKEAGAKYGVPWQVLYGLHITETGGRNGAIMNGSGSGARGPMQFMPGTWSAYGVDGNGDGVANIDDATDAIHGAANYLAKHGSLDNGLRSYGGAKARTLELAREQGYQQ